MNNRKENSKENNEKFLNKDFEIEESNAQKRLRGIGEADINEHESSITGRKIGKLENFWYQHKWHAGLIIFAIFFVIVVSVQIITRANPDVRIMYTGPVPVLGADYESLEAALHEAMGDYNKDGDKDIAFSDITYYSEKQIKYLKEAGGHPDEYQNAQSRSRFREEFSTGEYMFCMLDPELYKEMASIGSFVPLSEIFDTVPDSAYDEYGITLGDTPFYKSLSGAQKLPRDTVLCIRISAVLSARSDEEKKEYQDMHKNLLRDIVYYVPAEDTIASK